MSTYNKISQIYNDQDFQVVLRFKTMNYLLSIEGEFRPQINNRFKRNSPKCNRLIDFIFTAYQPVLGYLNPKKKLTILESSL